MIRSTTLLLSALTALDWLTCTGVAVLEPLRPVAGGSAITPTPGGPIPVVTPIPGGIGDPIGVPVIGPDLTGVALVIILAAAVIGLSRGVRRELVSVAVIAGSYLLFDRLWSLVTTYGNRFWRLFRFAILERGVLAEDPTVAWQSARATEPLLPATTGAGLWQLGLFVMAILIFGYGGARFFSPGPQSVTSFSQLPKLLERVVGGVLGAVGGTMISHFVLPRIVPNAFISLTGPRSTISEHIGEYGPALFFTIIIVLILFGVSGIGGSGPKQRVYS